MYHDNEDLRVRHYEWEDTGSYAEPAPKLCGGWIGDDVNGPACDLPRDHGGECACQDASARPAFNPRSWDGAVGDLMCRCGKEFAPTQTAQRYCSSACYGTYNAGLPDLARSWDGGL